MDEKTLIEHYKKKLSELNELLESDIDDIKLKVFAGAVVQSLAPQIQSL